MKNSHILKKHHSDLEKIHTKKDNYTLFKYYKKEYYIN